MKRIFTILIAFIIFIIPAVPSYAAMVEDKLDNIDTQKDVVFWVSWDTEEPQVVFIAPDGSIYDPKVQSQQTTTVMADKSLYYVVYSAQAGSWRVKYDKGKNKQIDISIHDYNPGISIQSFVLGNIENDRMAVKFSVSGKEGITYNYRIGAMIDHTGMEKVLTEGTATVGGEIERSFYLNKLSSYSAYMLRLYVWYDDNGTDIFDFEFSSPFSYTNTSLDANTTDFIMTVLPEDHLLEVAWPKLPYSTDSVLVAVFENDGKEPAMYDEYKVSEHEYVQLAYDPKATKVSVEFTPKVDGVSVATLRKTAQISDFGLTLPEGKSYNALLMPLKYKGFSKQPVAVTVNGYTTDLVFNGKGAVNITLGEDWNDLQVLYTDANNVCWKIQRQIFVDCTAPVLTMSRAYDGMTVDNEKIKISGTVVDCAKLTINGKKVKIKNNGSFSKEISLDSGENEIIVKAADELGNESRYTAVVTRGFTGTEADSASAASNADKPGGLLEALTSYGSYWVLLAASVVGLLIIGYALLFWRKGDNNEKDE